MSADLVLSLPLSLSLCDHHLDRDHVATSDHKEEDIKADSKEHEEEGMATKTKAQASAIKA